MADPTFAFPKGDNRNGYISDRGMTMREWYAGQVLPSIASNWHIYKVDEENAEILAKIAFSIANAMIKEGAKHV